MKSGTIDYLMKYWYTKYIIILACHAVMVMSTEFPSIIVSPYNPVFSCKTPTLNVKINDVIRFICPYYDAGFLMPPRESEKPLYENFYFIGENEMAFNNCDATGGDARPLLICKDEHSQTRTNYKMQFYLVSPSPSIPRFDKGKYYYVIGTGFRSKTNVLNRSGGSCNTTQTSGIFKDYPQYHIRLRIYVCKDDEECNLCKTNDCYSKGITCPSCQPWSTLSTQPSTDFTNLLINQTRTCFHGNRNNTEEQQKICPMKCSSSWEKYEEAKHGECLLLPFSAKTQCFALHTKSCKSEQCALKKSFCIQKDITCDTDPPTPNPAGQIGVKPESSNQLFFSVGIPAVIMVFIIGLALGFVMHRKYHRKNCLNFRMRHNQVCNEQRGQTNLAYQSSVSERPESVYFVDGKSSGEVFEEKSSKI